MDVRHLRALVYFRILSRPCQQDDASDAFTVDSTRWCESCKKDVKIGLGGEKNWDQHLKSKKHQSKAPAPAKTGTLKSFFTRLSGAASKQVDAPTTSSSSGAHTHNPPLLSGRQCSDASSAPLLAHDSNPSLLIRHNPSSRQTSLPDAREKYAPSISSPGQSAIGSHDHVRSPSPSRSQVRPPSPSGSVPSPVSVDGVEDVVDSESSSTRTASVEPLCARLLIELRSACSQLPSDISFATPEDAFAEVSGDPTIGVDNIEEAWEEAWDKALNRVVGYGATVAEVARLIRRGGLGLEGFCVWIGALLRVGVAPAVLEGRVQHTLNAVDFLCVNSFSFRYIVIF